MAAAPMAVALQLLLVTLSLLLLLAAVETQPDSVFVDPRRAALVLRRTRRKNSDFEELRPGSIERECREETCSFEEAKEAVGHEQAKIFWARYRLSQGGFQGRAPAPRVTPCRPNPCKNGGRCLELRSAARCVCAEGWEGDTCHVEIRSCDRNNGGCEHYCEASRIYRLVCHCARGYQLSDNGFSCDQIDLGACGRTVMDQTGRSLGGDGDVWEPDRLVAANATADATANATANATAATNSSAFPAPPERIASPLPPPPQPPTEQGSEALAGGGPRPMEWGPPPTGEPEAQAASTVTPDGMRIVGGYICPRGHCPWQVLLTDRRGNGFCGGTLVSARWVVTAAHCARYTKQVLVRIGEHDVRLTEGSEQNLPANLIVPHPNFDSDTFDSDLALLRLNSSARLDRYAVPACLPDRRLAELLTQPGTLGVVSGWGREQEHGRNSRYLQWVGLPVVPTATCAQSTEQKVTQNMFCAGYAAGRQDACKGDSGGPYMSRRLDTWFLTGVTSWGEGCAQRGKYGAFTRLANFIDWIEATMRENAS
ncbi:LOW QUALITY PROTEIN: vitamin K-dependent protein C-like [Lethenteron reissneri]|uniref:LOW QUALITY PROTEIN: vitamin K-dependent protein C-like n=1 Tax=Lethenteron reissneri TaxID=7753 RepID=UPI002AB61F7D|nr:LOW QUALITY PROTEIN: vitamin K-dependent protein C-like [Lethenteron reissneri]